MWWQNSRDGAGVDLLGGRKTIMDVAFGGREGGGNEDCTIT